MFRLPSFRLALATAALLVSSLAAQEHKELGRMWTFENAPLDWFEKAYGFRPTQKWMDDLRLASLRFGEGCSASFVSAKGLIITNNHCAQDYVGKVSPADQDWIVDGFFAAGLEQEVRIPNLTVQQLIGMKDVTAAMNEGLTAEMTPKDRQSLLTKNRQALLATAAEKDATQKHELVTLYQGGMYQIYSYKIYSDIRLVCAPQLSIAEFGGDPDNFTYPRFCLDFAMCRAYEDDKPADTSGHYLRWKTDGAKEGDTVFVTGNPGSTGRLNTIAQMEFMRDVQYPRSLQGLRGRIQQMKKAIEKDPKTAKNLRSQLLMFENANKAYTGYLDGLKNPAVMAVKRAAEKKIRDRIAADPDLDVKYGGAWKRLEEIAAKKREGGGGRELAQEEQQIVKTIGEAFFAVYGTDIPPDATFSLRISDGIIDGYAYNGTKAPWFTSLYGLYARNTEFAGAKPFDLPTAWQEKVKSLDLTTPFNFVTTCDIIGGNSGSPLVDKEGRFVGLVFDGNIESLGNRFVFTDDTPRTLCVHPAIIITALREIYDRNALADELEGKDSK